jgi:hypothetical protein
MVPVACLKCSVVVFETASGGWQFDPTNGMHRSARDGIGREGEFEWCPTPALALPG